MEKSKMLIMLDAGHGSNTLGKHSPLLDDKITRLYEYSYVREIEYRVYNTLISQGYNVYIVHPEIEELVSQNNDLSLRVKRANEKYNELKKIGNSAMFISIHVNAAGSAETWLTGRGWEAYTSIGLTGGDKLANKLYEAAHKYLDPIKMKIREDYTDKDPDKESNFYVLKNTNCPACLVENFFMDNKKDVEFLISEEGKTISTNILVDGIKTYIESL